MKSIKIGGLSPLQEKFIAKLTPVTEPLGYEVIMVDVLNLKDQRIRVTIDWPEGSSHAPIGIEDCVKVSHAVDAAVEAAPDVEALFQGPYELEVSSPGVARPLRWKEDFDRFQGERARIHVLRPLSTEEIENPTHLAKNPKQKNFLGIIRGTTDSKIRLLDTTAPRRKNKKKSHSSAVGTETKEILIPIALITQAHLEPELQFGKKGT